MRSISGSSVQIQTPPLYFDREDVKRAIHAPNMTWEDCSSDTVFPNGDNSPLAVFGVLPNVIERSQRTVIAQGTADFLLMSEG